MGGRPADEYAACYPMKKCRSHTSISQAAAECGVQEEACGGCVVASAPENAICLVDTDGDAGCFDDVDDADGLELRSASACGACSGGGAAAAAACGGGAPPTALASSSFSLRPHSGSSSMMLSSPSGASTPPTSLSGPVPPAAALGKGQPAQPQAQREQPAPSPAPALHQHHQQQEQQQERLRPEWECGGVHEERRLGRCSSCDGRASADGRAAGPQCGAARGVERYDSVGRPSGGGERRSGGSGAGGGQGAVSGSDFMGAFGVLTSEQWESLQCAITGCAAAHAEGPDGAEAAAAEEAEANAAARACRRASSAGVEAAPAAMPTAAAQPPQPASAQVGSGGGRRSDSSGAGGGGGDDGSAESITSLWAAVNAAAAASVAAAASSCGGMVGSIDENAAAAAALRPDGGGWAGLRPHTLLSPIRTVPVVPPTATSPLRYERQPPCSHHHGRHPNEPHSPPAAQQHDYNSGFTFRHTHHAGDSCGGRMVFAAAGGARLAAVEEPGSPGSLSVRPSGGSFGGLVEGGGGGAAAAVLVRQRSRTLEGYVGGGTSSRSLGGLGGAGGGGPPPPPPHVASPSRASLDSASPFRTLHTGGGGGGGGGDGDGGGGGYYHSLRQASASVAAAAAVGHVGFAQRLPAPPSYLTYGYRRARSSLAALEQNACGGGGGSGGGGGAVDDSSSDDDTEEATRRITAAFRTHTGVTRSSGWGLLGIDSAPSTPTGEGARRDPWGGGSAQTSGSLGVGAGEGEADGKEGGEGEGEGGAGSALLARKRSSYHLTNGHAAVELFLRLNHARQTMDFVKRQTQLFAGLDKARMSVWEALGLLEELREYEAVLMADGAEAQDVAALSLRDHAFQTAELCRLHHPELDWLHLVGLIHGLGKLLAHRRFGSQPQWAICGETFPLGCRFSPHILGSQYFTANPDRRRRLYNTPTGIYGPGCGLLNVVMSWSAPEYLYLVLLLNRAPLPQDALWVLRHAKFASLARPHSCYLPLCSPDDLRRLPLLRSFQQLAAFRRAELPPGFALAGQARDDYYAGLVDKYIGAGLLHW